jgi:hypothetical protein
MTRSAWTRVFLYPEDRELEYQQYQEDHDEDIEQEAGDIGADGRYVGKAENAGDDRNQKEK